MGDEDDGDDGDNDGDDDDDNDNDGDDAICAAAAVCNETDDGYHGLQRVRIFRHHQGHCPHGKLRHEQG